MIPMNKKIEPRNSQVNFTSCASLEFGMLYFCSKSNIFKFVFNKNLLLTTQVAQEIFNTCNQFAGTAKYYLITEMPTKITIEKEVYEFYNDPIRAEHILKEVFILFSSIIRIEANNYFKIKRPKVKGKVFDNEEEAIDWLLTVE